MICVSEERACCAIHEKINKNKVNDRKKKLSVVFDGAMSNAYENSIFATVHNLPAQETHSPHYVGKVQCFLRIKN
jgi:hypothetical protein